LLPPIELEPSASAMDPNRLPYADFLRDILLDGSADSGRGSHIQGLTVLDFCDHENLELTVEDLANLEGTHGLPPSGWKPCQLGRGRD
jgi:hypothetical protein